MRRGNVCYEIDDSVAYPVYKVTGSALYYELYDVVREDLVHVVLDNVNMAVGSPVREMVRDELTPSWVRTTMPS